MYHFVGNVQLSLSAVNGTVSIHTKRWKQFYNFKDEK